MMELVQSGEDVNCACILSSHIFYGQLLTTASYYMGRISLSDIKFQVDLHTCIVTDSFDDLI